MKDLCCKTSKRKIMAAELTVGMDKAAFFYRVKNSAKSVPSKAIFGKKHIRFKTPPLQWEQTYTKMKGGLHI